MNFTIREARGTDAESITRVLNPIIEARTNSVFTEAFSVDAEQEFIVKFPKRGVFHVAESVGIVKGFQTIESFATYTTALDHVGIIGTFVGFLCQNKVLERRYFRLRLWLLEPRVTRSSLLLCGRIIRLVWLHI